MEEAKAQEAGLYTPPAYAAADPRAIVNRYPFALLTTCGPDGPIATSVPILFETDDPDDLRLVGHLSRHNPHAATLAAGQKALAVFAGPHAYVSAGWYRDRPTVPTWNYVAAHARGRLQPFDDDATQIRLLERLITKVEEGQETPWSMAQAPEGRVAELLPRIRSFRIDVTRLEGVTKLSQSQPAGDRARVIAALEARGGFGDLDVADLMRANEPRLT